MLNNGVALPQRLAASSDQVPTLAKRIALRAITNRQGLAKFALDWTLSLILFVLTAPLILLAALAVKLTSRGPVFYCQTRLGRGGQPYTIYKIRTMIHNCESISGACWSTVGDPRITVVGRLLRRTHVDELPQLWNVLRGDMSLVGPRPERPEFVPKLAQAIPGYRERLLVRPGVTGLAQVQLPPDTDLDSVRRKLAFDLHYIQHASLALDLRLIAATACGMFAIPFTFSGTVLVVPSGAEIERAYESAVAAGDVLSEPHSELQPA
jgi:lipopolysaccharide/colanic/teichoic acid biosynthesis glycosyltransferase